MLPRLALAVIDMQPKFPGGANNSETINNCLREVKRATFFKHPIIFVEYIGFNPTHKILTENASKDYKVVKKDIWSGGDLIMKYLGSEHPSVKIIKICGIYTSCCVKATVNTIVSNSAYKVKLIKDACNDSYYDTSKHVDNANKLFIQNRQLMLA